MPHVAVWPVQVFILEQDGTTTARAVLATGHGIPLQGYGTAHWEPGAITTVEGGDKLAAARALSALAGKLRGEAQPGRDRASLHPAVWFS